MSTLRNILRWPAKKGNSLNPWYTILWRLAVAGAIYYPGLILATVAIGLLYLDAERAADFWKDNT